MKKAHKPKTKRKIYVARLLKVIAFVFIIGIFCGAGVFKLIHTCDIGTVEATEIAVEQPKPEHEAIVVEQPKPEQETKAVVEQPKPEQEVEIAIEQEENEQETTEIVVEAETAQEPESNLRSLGTFKLTAYCPCNICCGKSDGITASGTKATAGRTVAVDESIPFGTKLIIDGHEYVVEDRGGAIKGNKIDVFFSSHTEAINFGVQYREVFICEETK